MALVHFFVSKHSYCLCGRQPAHVSLGACRRGVSLPQTGDENGDFDRSGHMAASAQPALAFD
jgi:hypothetical protein